MTERLEMSLDANAWFHRVRGGLQELARQNVFVGTSSWKYPGWCGKLYQPERYLTRKKFSTARFDRECLTEYAELFPTVCVDAGYYAFPTPATIDRLVQQTPPDFKFCFKVTDEITIEKFPRIERFGPRAGRTNPHFFDAALFEDAFLGPLLPHRWRIGLLIFEFAQMQPFNDEVAAGFVRAVDHFLAALPAGWQYGVEVRNPGLLRSDYFAVLRAHGVAHVFNSWERMPAVSEQMKLAETRTAEFLGARFLLKPGRKYDDAVSLFSPYDVIKEPLLEPRAAGAALIREAADRGRRPSFILVNNRLEGNALETITAMLAQAGVL
jgi:uncharacterized protein YecE (DUF72 family)